MKEKLGSREERRWLEEKALPRVPTSRLKKFGKLLEDAGYRGFQADTAVALDLHDYQYHGPDPEMELSKYFSKDDVAADITYLARRIYEYVALLKPRLGGRWGGLHEELFRALGRLVGEGG